MPKLYELVWAGPSGVNVVGCHMCNLSICRIYSGECEVLFPAVTGVQ
jgi:hypothetical protein